MPVVSIKCEHCGESFKRPSWQMTGEHQYCSSDCYHASKQNKMQVECAHCGSHFYRRRDREHSRYFCSRTCQHAASKTRVSVPCTQCGKLVERKPSQIKKVKNVFCSRKCQGAQQRNQVTDSCAHCGKEITRPACQMQHDRHFCSMECRSAVADIYAVVECQNCGQQFESFEPPSRRNKFCSPECRGEHRSKSLSGENSAMWAGGWKSYYGPDWNRQSRKARQRDNHTCQICGLVESENYRALDVHHIKPFSTFGYAAGENDNHKQANHIDNLVTLCPACHGAVEHGDAELP